MEGRAAALAPYIRYALIFLAAKISAGTVLPESFIYLFAEDPWVVEQIMAGLVGLGTLFWYWKSTAYAVLKDALPWLDDRRD